jgi:2-oxoglutarate dehydrogenase E2 component (dihydrolipoamide succinyltransferase)
MSTDVRIPQLGESVTEGVITRWLKQDGELVRADEPILELETDKAALDIPATASGRLRIVEAQGATVKVGALVARIDPADAATPSADETPRPSPAVRTMVAEQRLEPSAAPATGPGGGAITDDRAEGPRPAVEAVRSAAPAAGGEEETARVPMTTLRRRIAERLVEAQQSAAILTTFNEVDCTQLMAVRKRYRERFKTQHGVDLGLMSLFGRAVVLALHDVPIVNARIDGDAILYHEHVHLGIAVATPRGPPSKPASSQQLLSPCGRRRRASRRPASRWFWSRTRSCLPKAMKPSSSIRSCPAPYAPTSC